MFQPFLKAFQRDFASLTGITVLFGFFCPCIKFLARHRAIADAGIVGLVGAVIGACDRVAEQFLLIDTRGTNLSAGFAFFIFTGAVFCPVAVCCCKQLAAQSAFFETYRTAQIGGFEKNV